MSKDGGPRVAMLAMGCRWVLDLSALPPDDRSAMVRRWSRCIALAGEPSSPVIDDTEVSIRPRPPGNHDDPAATDVLTHTEDGLPYDLSRAITLRSITRLTGQALKLHAAALTDQQARAIVLVAPSGTGKSTASAALGRDLGYVTDESVVILRDGRIAPYPKPPSLIVDPDNRGHKQEVSPDDHGLGPTPPAPVVHGLLTLTRSDEARPPRIEPVDLIDHLLTILPETSSIAALPGGLARLAEIASLGGGPARLVYAEIGDCAHLVASHLDPSGTPPSWIHHPPTAAQTWREDETKPNQEKTESGEGSEPAAEGGQSSAPGDRRFERAPWTDAIEYEGDFLILRGPVPILLQGVGASLWRACATPSQHAELVASTVADWGEHPQAGDLVTSALDGLIAAGLLRCAEPAYPTGASARNTGP